MKRIAFLVTIVALLALAGCAGRGDFVTPPGQENVPRPTYSQPVVYVVFPTRHLLGVERMAGIKVRLSANWAANWGFLKINGEVVPVTSLPAIFNDHWAWFARDEDQLFSGTVFLPKEKLETLKPQDISILSPGGFIRLKTNEVNWKLVMDFSPKTEAGVKNLRFFLERYKPVKNEELEIAVTAKQFYALRLHASFGRRVVAAAPTVSPSTLVVTWPFDLGLWIINLGVTEANYGGDCFASVNDIRQHLDRKYNSDHLDVQELFKALERREAEERNQKRQEALNKDSEE